MTKQISPLRQRMIDDMEFRNMSPNTQKVYAYAVANFARFHRQSPDKLGLEHVREYRLHLMLRGLKASSINPRPRFRATEFRRHLLGGRCVVLSFGDRRRRKPRYCATYEEWLC